MRNTKTKRMISALLAAVILILQLPLAALAADTGSAITVNWLKVYDSPGRQFVSQNAKYQNSTTQTMPYLFIQLSFSIEDPDRLAEDMALHVALSETKYFPLTDGDGGLTIDIPDSEKEKVADYLDLDAVYVDTDGKTLVFPVQPGLANTLLDATFAFRIPFDRAYDAKLPPDTALTELSAYGVSQAADEEPIKQIPTQNPIKITNHITKIAIGFSHDYKIASMIPGYKTNVLNQSQFGGVFQNWAIDPDSEYVYLSIAFPSFIKVIGNQTIYDSYYNSEWHTIVTEEYVPIADHFYLNSYDNRGVSQDVFTDEFLAECRNDQGLAPDAEVTHIKMTRLTIRASATEFSAAGGWQMEYIRMIRGYVLEMESLPLKQSVYVPVLRGIDFYLEDGVAGTTNEAYHFTTDNFLLPASESDNQYVKNSQVYMSFFHNSYHQYIRHIHCVYVEEDRDDSKAEASPPDSPFGHYVDSMNPNGGEYTVQKDYNGSTYFFESTGASHLKGMKLTYTFDLADKVCVSEIGSRINTGQKYAHMITLTYHKDDGNGDLEEVVATFPMYIGNGIDFSEKFGAGLNKTDVEGNIHGDITNVTKIEIEHFRYDSNFNGYVPGFPALSVFTPRINFQANGVDLTESEKGYYRVDYTMQLDWIAPTDSGQWIGMNPGDNPFIQADILDFIENNRWYPNEYGTPVYNTEDDIWMFSNGCFIEGDHIRLLYNVMNPAWADTPTEQNYKIYSAAFPEHFFYSRTAYQFSTSAKLNATAYAPGESVILNLNMVNALSYTTGRSIWDNPGFYIKLPNHLEWDGITFDEHGIAVLDTPIPVNAGSTNMVLKGYIRQIERVTYNDGEIAYLVKMDMENGAMNTGYQGRGTPYTFSLPLRVKLGAAQTDYPLTYCMILPVQLGDGNNIHGVPDNFNVFALCDDPLSHFGNMKYPEDAENFDGNDQTKYVIYGSFPAHSIIKSLKLTERSEGQAPNSTVWKQNDTISVDYQNGGKFRLTLTNNGNLNITMLKLYNILPNKSGHAVSGTAAFAEWDSIFADLTFTVTNVLTGETKTLNNAKLQYATTYNITISEGAGLTRTGEATTWVDFTPETDLSQVKALRFDLNGDVFMPGDSLVITATLKSEAGAVKDTKSTDTFGVVYQYAGEAAGSFHRTQDFIVTDEVPGSVSGTVYKANNAGEITALPYEGVTVTLWIDGAPSLITPAVTKADGTFVFTGLAPGSTYQLHFAAPSGSFLMTQSAASIADPATGLSAQFSIQPNQAVTGKNAGMYRTGIVTVNYYKSDKIAEGPFYTTTLPDIAISPSGKKNGTVVYDSTKTPAGYGSVHAMSLGYEVSWDASTATVNFYVAPLVFTVTYVNNNAAYTGALPNKATDIAYMGTHAVGFDLVAPPGFVFYGWQADTAGNPVYFSGASITDITQDIVLTALWQPVTFTVTYQPGAPDTTGDLPAGNPFTGIAYNGKHTVYGQGTLARNGYRFIGWRADDGAETMYQADEEITGIQRNYVLTAVWQPLHYTVTYHNDNADTTTGAVPDQDIVDHGGSHTVAGDNGMIREGFEFKGWLDPQSGRIYSEGMSIDNITRNYDLYALWTPLGTYTVTYIDDNADRTGELPPQDTVYAGGSHVVFGDNGMRRPTHSFLHWRDVLTNDTYTGGETITDIRRNITLEAVWLPMDPDTVRVIYRPNGAESGTVPPTQTIPYGTAADIAGNTGALAIPYKVFAGWNTAADGSGVRYTGGQQTGALTEDLILYAQWTPQTADITVHFVDADTDTIIQTVRSSQLPIGVLYSFLIGNGNSHFPGGFALGIPTGYLPVPGQETRRSVFLTENAEEFYYLERVEYTFSKTPGESHQANGLRLGDRVDYTFRNFLNQSGAPRTGYTITDYPPEGLMFVRALLPVFTGGEGLTYSVVFITNTGRSIEHLTGLKADEPHNIDTMPALEEGERFISISIKFDGYVPVNFGADNEIVFTFEVTIDPRNAPSNVLINRAGYGYKIDDDDDEPIEVVDPGTPLGPPETGDSRATAFWISSLLTSLGALLLLGKKKRTARK